MSVIAGSGFNKRPVNNLRARCKMMNVLRYCRSRDGRERFARERRGCDFCFFFGGGQGKGERRGGEVEVAAHSRTCTRLFQESATTMRPSLSMAMPPQGWLNCPLPEPQLPMERTWALSL